MWRSIPTMDAQEGNGDNIPRSMPFGFARVVPDRLRIDDLCSGPFYDRVYSVKQAIQNGIRESDLIREHGSVVVREAMDQLRRQPPPKPKQTVNMLPIGRRPILKPCPTCGAMFGGRGMRKHTVYCKGKRIK